MNEFLRAVQRSLSADYRAEGGDRSLVLHRALQTYSPQIFIVKLLAGAIDNERGFSMANPFLRLGFSTFDMYGHDDAFGTASHQWYLERLVAMTTAQDFIAALGNELANPKPGGDPAVDVLCVHTFKAARSDVPYTLLGDEFSRLVQSDRAAVLKAYTE